MNDISIEPRRYFHVAAWIAALLALGGCASIPDVTVSYRPVKWSAQVAIVHTITCTRDLKKYIVSGGATPVAIYSADTLNPPFQIRLKDLDRFYADSELSLAFTDDGRLKSINQSTTGQGDTIVKAALTAVTALAAAPAAAPAMAPAMAPAPPAIDPICAIVRDWGLALPGQLPQVSVIQTAGLSKEVKRQMADLSDDQKDMFNELKQKGLDLSATVTATLTPGAALQPIAGPRTEVGSNEIPLRLQQIGSLRVTASDTRSELGGKTLPIPMPDSTFVLPIPKAALFGKQAFQLTLADSGQITSMGYNSTSGAAGALGAFSSVVSQPVTEDTAKAAALQAASDLIAQQQRYANCLLKPTECK